MIKTIAFDADDTLWHNERFFKLTKESFTEFLVDYAEADHLEERLIAAEKRNLSRYGFGVKGFTLSMIETAIEVADEDLPASVIKKILDAGRDMLWHPVELLPGVADTIEALARTHRLLIVTKGDLFDQERKIAASGIAELFDGVEIVSDKKTATYRDIFTRYGAPPDQNLMIGNSIKSDVVPAIEAGGWGVYAPHELTWVVEHEEPPREHPRFREVGAITDLPAVIAMISEV